MEIDFHHGTVYVLSRMAGFTPDDACVIAYSSQYVDDAGAYFASQVLKMFEWHAVFFEDYGIFEYIDSSHTIFTVANWKELDQHKVWVPFHFIPSGIGKKFIDKIICKKAWSPQSQWTNPVAKDLVDEVVNNAGNYAWGLQRLGITMHVLADTFAHQNFAGINCQEDNNVKNVTIVSPAGFAPPGTLVRNLPCLGHARAEHLPDLPFVNWKYYDDNNQLVIRNNPLDYIDAIDALLKVLQDYQKKFKPGPVPSPDDVAADRQKIISLFTQFTDKEGKDRDARWVQSINNNGFKCCTGHEKTDYKEEGQDGSWWKEVESMCPWSDWLTHPVWYAAGYRQYNQAFMTCKYKLFQDALISHRNYVSKILYPKYNICAL